jgi:hypothetical protein
MKTIDYIPTSKIERDKASSNRSKSRCELFKIYGKKYVNSDLTRDKLNESAEDILID